MDEAIRLSRPGGPDCLEIVDWPPPEPGPGEIRLRHAAIGVNFIDIYHRTGLYPLTAAAIPGVEGAGIVEAIGAGVTGLAVGQRVAYAGIAGAYAATRLLPAWRAVPLPDAVPVALAAASLMRGLTVHMLFTRTYPVTEESVLLVHAAAGGLGGLMTRWAKHLGARVIGTAGSPAKADVARGNGADEMIIGRDADVVGEVTRLTGGRGVDFAIDGIGGAMLTKTLACVRRFGTVASIGEAAGPIAPIRVEEIGPLRALSLARPSVMAYAAEKDTYPAAARAVLDLMQRGIAVEIGSTYALREAAAAHADLEGGRTTGALILKP